MKFSEAEIYKIKDGEMSAEILTYGGILKSLFVPDKNGVCENIVCGFDTLEDYKKSGGCFGETVGRCCNRIGNSRFTLDGKEYVLPANDGKNHLHGGHKGFGKRMWNTVDSGENFVELSIDSADGDMGYPGNLTATVRYTLKDKKLIIEYKATTDAPTPVNFTNHSYFDICGAYSGRTMEAYLKINASRKCDIDHGLIPTGISDVKGTPYDFTEEKKIGEDIDADDEMLRFLGGYDTNYFVDGEGMREMAVLSDPVSGRKMTLFCDQPCVQLYTANSVGKDEPNFAGNIPQTVHSGVCLETQAMPDAVNHPEIMDIILRPGKEYRRTAIFDFNA